ncbi:MAG: hypothetical protein HY550_11585 [Elusimicrobia bacterium]|nr:hypothetical protein [Elusimicrobiota bacterium]
MLSFKGTFGAGLAAMVISLSAAPAAASGFSFDAPYGNGALSETVLDLKERSKGFLEPDPPPAVTPSNELTRFWEDLKLGAMGDGLCKSAQADLNAHAVISDVVGLEGGLKRYLRQFPDNRIALIDEIRLKLGANFGIQALQVPNAAVLTVNVFGGVEGRSMVVRPLESKRYCKELGTLAKLYEVKTVLPASAGRIAGMEKGEIWKVPFIVRYGIGGGVSMPVGELVNITIGASYAKEGRPSVTLYRLDENTLRLRLRLDHLTVRTFGASAATVRIPAGELGLPGAENILAAQVDKSLAGEINKFIAFQLALGQSRAKGRKLLLEYYLDPDNPEQMGKLAEFLKGNIGIIRKLVEMGVRHGDFSEAGDDLNAQAGAAGAELGAEHSFAGADHYSGHSNNLGVNIPVIHYHQSASASVYHRYRSQDDGGVLHVQQRTGASYGESINIPVLGHMYKYNTQRNLYVVNKESPSGEVSGPALLYQHYEGFVRANDAAARGMLEKADGILRYAGVHGGPAGPGGFFPSGSIFPPPPPEAVKFYKAAVMSFKLLFNEKAVQDIIFAAPQAILAAYMNVMRETQPLIVDKVLDLFEVTENGGVTCDYREAAKRLGTGREMDHTANPLEIVRTLASCASGFIKDLLGVRNEAGWKARSERLADAGAGTWRSGLGYENCLKVMIQLVDVKDISAQLYVHTEKNVEGEEDVTRTYSAFGSGDGFDGALAEAGQMRDRFNDPSALTD